MKTTISAVLIYNYENSTIANCVFTDGTISFYPWESVEDFKGVMDRCTPETVVYDNRVDSNASGKFLTRVYRDGFIRHRHEEEKA